MRARLIWIVALSGCGFGARLATDPADDANIDAPVIDAYVPDAPAMCAAVTPPTCVPGSNILRECTTIGQPAIDTRCGWGCVPGPPDHCGRLVPSGGAVMTSDLDPDLGLQAKTVTSSMMTNAQFDTNTGAITGVRSAGPGILNGIDFQIRNGVGIWRFHELVISSADGAPVRFTGANGAALVSITTIEIRNTILDLRGGCTASTAGPGGNAGGAIGVAALGSGGGGAGQSYNGNRSGGGGGGGHGAVGGNGGRPAGETTPMGGPKFGTATITLLRGGGGGGGGGGPAGGVGGGGGGAIQLVANESIKIASTTAQLAGINAGGCGGKRGISDDAGGGGGAGGAILIEAPEVRLDTGALAANGGGGGGGGDQGTDGGNGLLATGRAAGGMGGNGGGNGGGGGAAGTNHAGQPGPDDDDAGGGGGAVGWIRVNTVSGNVSLANGAFTSPGFNDADSPATRGMPAVQ